MRYHLILFMSKSEPENLLSVIPAERIDQMIYVIRGQRVMLDADLADLYEVETKVLVRSVRRNKARFPEDFAFELTAQEWEFLRNQFGASNIEKWGGRRYAPFAFTEQGVAMLSSVLRSNRAALVNVAIMRAFVRMRRTAESYKDVAEKLTQLEKNYSQNF